MVTSQFDALLKELEAFFKCKLESDQNNACLIKMSTGLRIQLELDRYNEHLMIGSRLGIIPPGRYREMVFKEALKANELYLPSTGVFGYSKKSGNLILFLLINLRDFNSDKMITMLTAFTKKAQTWAQTLNRGDVPAAEVDSLPPPNTGLFGLMR